MWGRLINRLGDRPRKWAQGAAAWFSPSSDRRRASRYSLTVLKVYHWTGGKSEPEEVVSISETGAYFKTRDRWSLGTIMDLTLQIVSEAGNGWAGEPVAQHVVAKVVRCDPGGLCVQFLYADPRERLLLRSFLETARRGSQ